MEDAELSNLILDAFLARRSILIELAAGVRLLASRHSRDALRLREFLARNRMPYHWVDLDDDEEADALLTALGVEPADTPVVLGAGSVLRNPSNAELGAMLGLGARGTPPALCDVVIVGGGPAGLAAALYGASEGLDAQAIDSVALGGQASTSSRIENYLGFPTSGSELAERAALQASRLGARLVVPAEAVVLVQEDGHYRDVPDEDLAAYGLERPLFLETSRPGVFAVGDVHSGSLKRVASAVGEGSMAVRLVH